VETSDRPPAAATVSDRRRPVRISVVVPVYNRADSLGRLLASLGTQEFPRDELEILVCDDGSSADLEAEAERAAEAYNLRVVYLRQSNRGPGPARQLGLAHASGEVVVNTDSDCLAGPGWLSAWAEAFSECDVMLAGGPIDYHRASHLSGRCIGFLMASRFGGGGGVDPRTSLGLTYHPGAGNMATRRDVALELGGFPPIRYNEDTEFSRKFLDRGIRARFIEGAKVDHDESTPLARLFLENIHKGACPARHDDGPVAALPAGLVLALMAWPAAPWLGPYGWAVIGPLIAYGVVLLSLSVRGGMALRSMAACLAIPYYTLAIHIGFGAGYILARLGGLASQPDTSPINWREIRERAVVRRTFPCSRRDTPSVEVASTVGDGQDLGQCAPKYDVWNASGVEPSQQIQVSFAVVIPIHNEANTITSTTNTLLLFARQHPWFGFVFVDDGSKDGSPEILREILGKNTSGRLRLRTVERNQGKGYAIRVGIEEARGSLGEPKYFGFLDGDLAYNPSHLLQLERALKTYDVVIGTRPLSMRSTTRTWRIPIGRIFNSIVRWMLDIPQRDTQAGLKGFRASAARLLFERQRLDGMAFDAELLFLAKRFNMSIGQIPVVVSAHHVYKTNITYLVFRSIRMLIDLARIRVYQLLGRYGMPCPDPLSPTNR
jgi:dolichyl-phosphate beta-glucosyltransferase